MTSASCADASSCESKPKVPFWVGYHPTIVFLKGFLGVHQGTGVLTHSHMVLVTFISSYFAPTVCLDEWICFGLVAACAILALFGLVLLNKNVQKTRATSTIINNCPNVHCCLFHPLGPRQERNWGRVIKTLI